uniref:Uncharacterized protein n=1 Tax=viral metagenome TaxID=1070528 RepID=A0A6C0J1B2_9ZZZZ
MNTFVFVIKQKYHNRYQTNIDNFWGIGDIIRSIYGVYKLSLKYNFKLIVDISHHPISKFLIHNDHEYSSIVNETIDTIKFYALNEIDIIKELKDKKIIYIGLHYGLEAYESNEYEKEAQEFIKNILQPTKEFMIEFDKINNNISFENLNIIHFRLGDEELVRNIVNTDNYDVYYSKILHYKSDNTLLFSDSSKFKKYIKNKDDIKMLENEIGHIGYEKSYDKIKNTLIEYFLLTKASKIYTYTIYGWASGFIKSINKIYDVPIILI